MIDKNLLRADLRFLADMPGPNFSQDMDIAAARAQDIAIPCEHPDEVAVRDERFTSFDGEQIRVRLYEPVSRSEYENHNGKLSGAIYFMHGGGMALGKPEGDDLLMERFVLATGALVCSVDYRLAPEHPYPVPFEDCYSGLVWLREQADRLGFEADSIATAGASAGGNLCAAVTLAAKDRGGPAVMFHMPLFPMLDCRNDTDSAKLVTYEYLPFSWNSDFSEVAWRWYLGDLLTDDTGAALSVKEAADSGRIPLYASPALARISDLAGMPPAFTLVGQFDPLRDETITMARKLMNAGVACELHVYDGAFHGFEIPLNDTESGRQAVSEMVEAMRRAFR